MPFFRALCLGFLVLSILSMRQQMPYQGLESCIQPRRKRGFSRTLHDDPAVVGFDSKAMIIAKCVQLFISLLKRKAMSSWYLRFGMRALPRICDCGTPNVASCRGPVADEQTATDPRHAREALENVATAPHTSLF